MKLRIFLLIGSLGLALLALYLAIQDRPSVDKQTDKEKRVTLPTAVIRRDIPTASSNSSPDQSPGLSPVALAKGERTPDPTPAASRPPSPAVPALEALREVEEVTRVEKDSHLDAAEELVAGRGNNLIPGLGSSSPLLGSNTPGITEPTPTPSDPNVWLTGQARGYSMLYLMHPNAHATVERQVQVMLDARINELYLGVLTDGTFSQDFAYLASVVRRLTRAGRVLTLALYLSNGSSMRNYNSLPIDAGFNAIDPFSFRELIQYDTQVQNQFIHMARAVVPVFDLNRRLGRRNRNIAIVMLEDNLDRESYRTMRGLAKTVFRSGIEIIRNPCPGCVSGNDTDSLGDELETHAVNDLKSSQSFGGLSLDGVSYRFPGEPESRALSLQGVRNALTESRGRNVKYVGLWRAERQGITSPLIHPDLRTYEVPTSDQIKQEIELLRHGLDPLR